MYVSIHMYIKCTFFGFGNRVCEILLPQPGPEPRPMAVPRPNLWTSRELPKMYILTIILKVQPLVIVNE